MCGRLAAATAVIAVFLTATAGCGGSGASKTAVRSSDDAARYIDDVMRGTSASKFKLADDASAIATVAVKDSDPLTDLRTVVNDNREGACLVLDLVAQYADLAPVSTAPVSLQTGALMQIHLDAESNAVPTEVTDQTIGVAQRLAQSTFVDAANAACELIG